MGSTRRDCDLARGDRCHRDADLFVDPDSTKQQATSRRRDDRADEKVRAVRLRQVGKPLENADVPVSENGPFGLLNRIAAAGICHSDWHYRDGISRIGLLPVTLGHEIAGRIEKVGADIKHVRPGDRVCVHYLAHCGTCEFCVRSLEQFAVLDK